MRIITGDECGLLKEIIPEIADPKEDEKKAKITTHLGISRLEHDGVHKMCRSRGVVDMAFCQRSGVNEGETDSSDDSFAFCALRANGCLEYRIGNAPQKYKEDRVSGGQYSLENTIDNAFCVKGEEIDSSSIGRPIAISSAQQSFTKNTNRGNIIACCSSSGLVSVVDVNKFGQGVQAKYSAFAKRNGGEKLNAIKGNFTNRDIATTMSMDHDAKRVVVGGRERSAIMLDLETGTNVWKVSAKIFIFIMK